MRVLIIDFHVGCILSTASSLLAAGASVEILSMSGATHYLIDNGLAKHIVSQEKRKSILNTLDLLDNCRISRRGFVRDERSIQESVREGSIRKLPIPIYDVAWISFPPGLYSRVKKAGIAKQVVVNLGHRFDLWFSDHAAREIFHEKFRKDVMRGEVKVFSTNKFDQEYLKYYLNIYTELLEPAFPYVTESLMDNSVDMDLPILIGPVHIDLNYGVVPEVVSKINSALGMAGSIISIRDYYSKYSFQQLVRHKGFVLFPYSIFSISMSELATLGRPLFIPSNSWLDRMKILTDVQLWPIYSNKQEVMKFTADQNNLSPNAGALHLSWINYASWHSFPNVYYWNSTEELIDLLTKPGLYNFNELSDSSRKLERMKFDIFEKFVRRLTLD